MNKKILIYYLSILAAIVLVPINSTAQVAAELGVALEGAYNINAGLMNVTLSQNGLLPTAQPFNTEPWDYAGTEAFGGPNPPPGLVDWVLVELRDANDPSVTVTQKAGYIVDAGFIIDLPEPGSQPGIMNFNVAAGDYYIIIRSRNHLAIMSANPVTLPTTNLYDFRDPANVMGGAAQMVDVDNGTYAMYAGDVNSDGVITVADFNAWVVQSSAINTYIDGDLNADGNVTVADFNLYVPNASRIGVPPVRYQSCPSYDCLGVCGGTATTDVCGVCNGPGQLTWYEDADFDGLGNASVSTQACTQPTGYVANSLDADDTPCASYDCLGVCDGTAVADVCGVCNGPGQLTWYEDADSDGLGNASVSTQACTQPTGYVANNTDTDDTVSAACETADGLHLAFAEFDPGSYNIYISGSNVVLETDGLPNHESPYWSTTHPLYIAPTVTSTAQMAPGDIDDFNGSYTLSVPVAPALAASPSSTGLGAIGLAVSGSVIYNDEEGPGVPLDSAAGSLDFNGAHTGPQSYHYHLEPTAWSEDDDALIGIMSDGFFLYGRKCNSTGTYPTDLDASGGHTSSTQHTCGQSEYHYHIQNELYIGLYYILFPGDYQGTPNNIN